MGKKHFDNKNDLISRMRATQKRADHAVSATFTAYMMLALTVLYEDLGFRDKRLRKFINGFYKRLDMYNAGTLTVDSMEAKLLNEAGVYVEPPRVEG